MSGAASLRSPRGAPRKQQQTASGYPIGKALPQSQRRAGKAAAKRTKQARCGSETGSKPEACRPCHAGSPGTPAHAQPPRSSGPGVSARSLLRPAPMLAGHALAQRPPPLSSLHDTRHRSCTGSRLLAALPDLHALRHCSGKAAAAGSGLELRNETESNNCAWPNSAHNSASVIRNCKQLPCCLWQHSYNSCYAHNRPRRPAAASGQGLRAAAAKLLLLPSAERPAAAARCCSSTGRASVSGRRHLGPQLLHAAAAARAGQGRAAPSRTPPPPPTCPPSASSGKAGPVGLAFPAAVA